MNQNNQFYTPTKSCTLSTSQKSNWLFPILRGLRHWCSTQTTKALIAQVATRCPLSSNPPVSSLTSDAMMLAAKKSRDDAASAGFELLAVGFGLVVVQIVVGHLLSLVPTYVPRLVSWVSDSVRCRSAADFSAHAHRVYDRNLSRSFLYYSNTNRI